MERWVIHRLPSMGLTVARQMLFLLPLMLLLTMTEQVSLIWLAFPAAEMLGIFVGLYYHNTTLQLL